MTRDEWKADNEIFTNICLLHRIPDRHGHVLTESLLEGELDIAELPPQIVTDVSCFILFVMLIGFMHAR